MDAFRNCDDYRNILACLLGIKKELESNLIKNTDITKEELIRIAREKRKNENILKEWVNIRETFGQVLKLIKIKVKEKNMWEKLYETDKRLFCGNLYTMDLKLLFPNYSVKVIKVASCNNTIIVKTQSNGILAKGNNNFYQTGIISEDSYLSEWTQINNPDINSCRDILISWSFSFFICEDKIFSCGCTANGRLGIGVFEEEKVIFSEVDISASISKVVAGSMNSYFLSDDGKVYSCGHRYYVGFNTEEDIKTPEEINFPSEFKIVDIQCSNGGYHLLALNDNGEVFSFGHNRVGQLGIPPDDMSMKIEHESDAHESDVDYVYEKTPILYVPMKIPFDKPILKISSGWGHSGFISNNQLYLFGRNAEGQIGKKDEECIINSRNHKYSCVLSPIILDFYITGDEEIICGHSYTIIKTPTNLYYTGKVSYFEDVNKITKVNINSLRNVHKVIDDEMVIIL